MPDTAVDDAAAHGRPVADAGFDARVRTFLDDTVPRRSGSAPRSIRILEEIDPGREAAVVAEARAWQAALDAAGLADLDERERARFERIAVDYVLPDRGPLLIGTHILAPAIAGHGSDDLRSRYLPRLRNGELVACQLFSEPDAGSDLASVRTTAVHDPVTDTWTLTGQKVWSSNARHADVGEALVRTDPHAPRHAGLTLFVVDMRSPGVEVRPLRQITGGAAFNEVFLTAVVVPDRDRIGPVGGGWGAAMASLSGERAALGGSAALPDALVPELVRRARENGAIDDPGVRERLVRADVAVRAARLYARRTTDGDVDPTASGPTGKLLVVRALRAVVAAALEVDGEATVLRDVPALAEWTEFVLGTHSIRIAGGTDEIQRSLLGERVLGLPKDPR